MELKELALICKAFRSLGDAVGEQIIDVIDAPHPGTAADQNFSALRIAEERFLRIIERAALDAGDDELLADIDEVRAAIADAKIIEAEDALGDLAAETLAAAGNREAAIAELLNTVTHKPTARPTEYWQAIEELKGLKK